jgi:hypothetical protein
LVVGGTTLSLREGVCITRRSISGEQPATSNPIQRGQTAGIGFWNSKNGQALIKALNGGTGTQLGDWLAATFPHLFVASSGGNNLTGQNNAYVASFFQSRFVVQGQKLDTQVLATALAVYVTDPTLDSTVVGSQYGFIVGSNGLATAMYDVGGDGAVFGVADDTTMTVMDLLKATDAQAVDGGRTTATRPSGTRPTTSSSPSTRPGASERPTTPQRSVGGHPVSPTYWSNLLRSSKLR